MLFNLTGALLKRENNNQTRWVWGEAAWKVEDTQRGTRTQAIRDWVGRWPRVTASSVPKHIAGVAPGLHHQNHFRRQI